jgi:uncharacterized membrane protein HdeD (DUF308 family)
MRGVMNDAMIKRNTRPVVIIGIVLMLIGAVILASPMIVTETL